MHQQHEIRFRFKIINRQIEPIAQIGNESKAISGCSALWRTWNILPAAVVPQSNIVSSLLRVTVTNPASWWDCGVDAQIYETHDFYKQPEKYWAFLANLVGDSEHLIVSKLVWSTARQCQEDAFLILKEPFAEHGNKSVERYHLCSNWCSKYWKSRADLTACIAMTEKHLHVFLKGNKTAGDITDFCEGKRFVTDLDELP